MQTDIHLPFGDGVYRFRLPLPMIYEVQRKTKTGIGALFARVLEGRYVLKNGGTFGMPTEAKYSAEDLIETVRCGLIGGGEGLVNGETVKVNAPAALTLVETYLYPAAPFKEAWDMAASILTACVEGYDEPDQKKSAEPAEAEPQTPADGSTMPSPSATLPSAGRARSKRAR